MHRWIIICGQSFAVHAFTFLTLGLFIVVDGKPNGLEQLGTHVKDHNHRERGQTEGDDRSHDD